MEAKPSIYHFAYLSTYRFQALIFITASMHSRSKYLSLSGKGGGEVITFDLHLL